jgi:hypothetical protein
MPPRSKLTFSFTRGFTAIGEPRVAICLLPGTEVVFEIDVRYDRALILFGTVCVEHKVARFRQVDLEKPHVHHDALEFPGGVLVMVTRLAAGQIATVLQLPARPMKASEADLQKSAAYGG